MPVMQNINISTQYFVFLKKMEADLEPDIDKDGNQRWFKDGKVHRENGPAIIWRDGEQDWYKDGKRHRDGDLPAVVTESGILHYYKYGKLHRDGDLPAIMRPSGHRAWYQDGWEHRDGDKPAVISGDGDEEWWRHGNRHRDGDMPAYVSDEYGFLYFYKNGECHRDFGPAHIRRSKPPKFYEHGLKRRPISVRGETLVSRAPASWSPVMCFM